MNGTLERSFHTASPSLEAEVTAFLQAIQAEMQASGAQRYIAHRVQEGERITLTVILVFGGTSDGWRLLPKSPRRVARCRRMEQPKAVTPGLSAPRGLGVPAGGRR